MMRMTSLPGAPSLQGVRAPLGTGKTEALVVNMAIDSHRPPGMVGGWR